MVIYQTYICSPNNSLGGSSVAMVFVPDNK